MKRKSNCLATILFLIYLALLVWIIVCSIVSERINLLECE